MCGCLADAQRGHTLRDGASSFHAPARWLRVFDFDFFFFGTAIVLSGSETGWGRLSAPGRVAIGVPGQRSQPAKASIMACTSPSG